MITYIRNDQRCCTKQGLQQIWNTFTIQDHADSLANSFGELSALDEFCLPPGNCIEFSGRGDMETITYVHKGALFQEDTTAYSGLIQAGEFQRKSAMYGIRQKETSVSRNDWAHLFRITLKSSRSGVDYGREQKRFTKAQRHNKFCVVASPDGRNGSLRIPQEVLVFTAILDPGYHLIYEFSIGRTAWLHTVCGEMIFNDIVLTQGDGVGVSHKRSISITAQENTEILLIDMGILTMSKEKYMQHEQCDSK